MALTPEDVVNKRFNPTKFREGYDQDEVDDFLDEVVVELRRLNQENEELRQRLMAADSRINELQAGGAPRWPPRSPLPHRCPEPAFAQAAAGVPTPPTRPTPTTCSSSPAASTRSTCARAWRSATRSSPRATPPPRVSCPRPSRPSAQHLGAARAGARRPRAPDRRAAHVRARVPVEAQGLHRGPAARPRDHERPDDRQRRRRGAAARRRHRRPGRAAVRGRTAGRCTGLQRTAAERLRRVPAAHRLPGLCRRQLSPPRRTARRGADASASAPCCCSRPSRSASTASIRAPSS